MSVVYRLRKSGFAVTVLEANEKVGGRISSEAINGFIMDRGTQFLSRSYTSVQPLNNWRHDEPLSPIGRSRAIREYRRNWTIDQRVILAGETMASPTTDGAAHSGLWAAETFIKAGAV